MEKCLCAEGGGISGELCGVEEFAALVQVLDSSRQENSIQ